MERNHADAQRFNVNVSRYNLMMVYPDGLDEESIPEVAPVARVPEPTHLKTIPLKPNDSQPALTPPFSSLVCGAIDTAPGGLLRGNCP